MKRMKCPICGKETNSFVHCGKERQAICWDHCRTCRYHEKLFSHCLYHMHRKVERIKELQGKRQTMI